MSGHDSGAVQTECQALCLVWDGIKEGLLAAELVGESGAGQAE